MQNNQYSEKWINAGGLNTRYLEAGDENAQPVILLHDGGFGGSADTSWAGVIPDLAKAGFRVLAPDMLGYGGTDKVYFFDRSPTEFRALHIGNFCTALGINNVHFVGTSFGGTLVLRALTMKTTPWPFASACSISGTGGPWRVPEAMAKLGEYDGTIESMDKNLMPIIVDPDYEGFDCGSYLQKRHAQSLIPGHFGALAAARLTAPWENRPAPAKDTFPASLSGCQVPVLLVEPEDDPSCEPNWGAKIQEVIPTARVEKISGRHTPNVDRPQLVVDTLVNWINQVTQN